MRAADGDGVDMICALRGGEAALGFFEHFRAHLNCLAQRPAAGRCLHIRRFGRHAENMEQPDPAGRSRRRAEGFQRVLARMRRNAGDDANRSSGEPPEQAAQNRKGDLAGQQRGGRAETSTANIARRFSARCSP